MTGVQTCALPISGKKWVIARIPKIVAGSNAIITSRIIDIVVTFAFT